MAEPGPPKMPRWVQVSLIIISVLILLVVILQATGLGGEHGPGRHVNGAGAGDVVTAVRA